MGRYASTPRRGPAGDRKGFTLVELMVALTIFGVVISVSLGYMAGQNRAFQTALDRMGALRNGRYALTVLAQDVETLGTNVPGAQPSLIYADSTVLTFSADYATNVANDPFAVFYDPSAPAGQVQAPTAPFTIPTTSVAAADSAYTVGAGVASPAEMLSFFFEADTSTARTDDYTLFRQVNGTAPEVVARNLLRDATTPFFVFEREVVDSAGDPALQAVGSTDLPIHHSEPFHLTSADTAASAAADSVRAVRLTVVASNGLSGDQERTVRVERRIALPNAGRGRLSTCGSQPIFGDSLLATPDTLTGGEIVVELSWGPAVDESGGEGDVVGYVIWRRPGGSLDWGEPHVAIPAGAPAYTYVDATVQSGGVYEFAVAAQDCTPSFSSLFSSPQVTIP